MIQADTINWYFTFVGLGCDFIPRVDLNSKLFHFPLFMGEKG